MHPCCALLACGLPPHTCLCGRASREPRRASPPPTCAGQAAAQRRRGWGILQELHSAAGPPHHFVSGWLATGVWTHGLPAAVLLLLPTGCARPAFALCTPGLTCARTHPHTRPPHRYTGPGLADPGFRRLRRRRGSAAQPARGRAGGAAARGGARGPARAVARQRRDHHPPPALLLSQFLGV